MVMLVSEIYILYSVTCESQLRAGKSKLTPTRRIPVEYTAEKLRLDFSIKHGLLKYKLLKSAKQKSARQECTWTYKIPPQHDSTKQIAKR